MVGRDAELEQLHKWLEKARNGERQIVFVTGEPGIGKTTVVETFLDQLAADGQIWIGRGQCIEHYGAGEAYLPVLEALGRLCRAPGGERCVALLSHHAPTWLVQMPTLLSTGELEALRRKTQGATRERMLRELAEALEMVTAERALVLRFEDLHWSDVSTLDWLAFVARRHEPCRLLVLGTYRPVEVIVQDHPLKAVKQELQVHGQCVELALRLLTPPQVSAYLAARFPLWVSGEVSRQRLVQLIHQRTDGNPLFIVTLVDYLLGQGVLGQAEGQWGVQGNAEEVGREVPESLWQMIAEQIQRLSLAEQRMLEVASVAGAEFSAAAVAAGLGTAVEEVEEQCEGLVRREHFLRASGTAEWPDGTVAARYQFLHALYQEVLYERVPIARRSGLHRRIGARTEAAYGAQAKEVAAELAVHFERGREPRKAVQYLQQAGENAMRRSASAEASSHLIRGLELLKTLPDTPERTQHELTLQLALGELLMALKGEGAAEVESVYTRALELCRQVGDTPQLFPAMAGLWMVRMVRGEFRSVRELAEQLLRLAQHAQDPALLLSAHQYSGVTLYYLGEFAPAREHLEQGIALYDPQQYRSQAFRAGLDPGVWCLCYMSWVLWFLGYPDQALKRSQEELTLAQDMARPYTVAYALFWIALFHQSRREAKLTQERAEAAIALSTEQGFPMLGAMGTQLRGWALAEQGRIEEGFMQMRQGASAAATTGEKVGAPFGLAMLAEVYEKKGQPERGLSMLAKARAWMDRDGERYYEAEVYRLKGELTLQSKVQGLKSKVKEAEECFLKAIEIARRQQAKSLELRAAPSLARLWQQQGKKAEAREMLAEIYGWFTEGFETKDLQEARALLEELT